MKRLAILAVVLVAMAALAAPTIAQETEPLPDYVATKDCPATVAPYELFTCNISITNQGTATAVLEGSGYYLLRDELSANVNQIYSIGAPSGYTYTQPDYDSGPPPHYAISFYSGASEYIEPGETISGFSITAQAGGSETSYTNCAYANPGRYPESDDQNNQACDSTQVVQPPPPPPDQDQDTVPDASDNCPTVANLGQEDRDEDGYGDVCDAKPNNKNRH